MTNEELVEKIQQGERDLLPQLWEQVERFVRKLACERVEFRADGSTLVRGVTGLELDDLMQAGYIAFLAAVDRFKPTRDVLFSTVLGVYLKQQFNLTYASASGMTRGIYGRAQGLSKAKKEGKILSQNDERMLAVRYATSLNDTIKTSDGDASEIGYFVADPNDLIGDAEERIYQQQLHAALEEALGQLPENQEKVIRLRFYQELSQGEVCEQLGISRERVRETQERALWNLKKCRNLESYIDRRSAQYVQQYVEERTPYYMRVGVDAFHSSGESAVERIVFKRERLEQQALERIARLREQNQIREESVK